MWLESISARQHIFLSEECTCLKLISTADGKILWANRAFREWSEYTLHELQRLGWMDLSVRDDSLEADMAEVKMIEAGQIQEYQVQKKYRNKSGQAITGTLIVKRFPVAGQVEWYACTWEPHKNGTAAAFSMAMEQCAAVNKKIETMTTELKQLSAMSDGETLIVKTARLAVRHPKTAILIVAMFASLVGLESIVLVLQRLGYMPLPVRPEAAQVEKNNDYRSVMLNL